MSLAGQGWPGFRRYCDDYCLGPLHNEPGWPGLAWFPRCCFASKSFVKASMCSYEKAGWLGCRDLVSGLTILLYELFIPVTRRKIIQYIFVIKGHFRVFTSLFFDNEA